MSLPTHKIFALTKCVPFLHHKTDQKMDIFNMYCITVDKTKCGGEDSNKCIFCVSPTVCQCTLKVNHPRSFCHKKEVLDLLHCRALKWLYRFQTKSNSRFSLYYRALSKFSAVGAGGSSSPMESVPPEKMCNSMRGSLIKKQVNPIYLFLRILDRDSSRKSLVCVSLLSITMMCLSLVPISPFYSFLLALQFLCLFSVKAADEREMLSSRYTEQIQSFPSTSLSYMCSRKQSSMAIRRIT